MNAPNATRKGIQIILAYFWKDDKSTSRSLLLCEVTTAQQGVKDPRQRRRTDSFWVGLVVGFEDAFFRFLGPGSDMKLRRRWTKLFGNYDALATFAEPTAGKHHLSPSLSSLGLNEAHFPPCRRIMARDDIWNTGIRCRHY